MITDVRFLCKSASTNCDSMAIHNDLMRVMRGGAELNKRMVGGVIMRAGGVCDFVWRRDPYPNEIKVVGDLGTLYTDGRKKASEKLYRSRDVVGPL